MVDFYSIKRPKKLPCSQVCLGKKEYQVWNLSTFSLPPSAQMEDWMEGEKGERIVDVAVMKDVQPRQERWSMYQTWR